MKKLYTLRFSAGTEPEIKGTKEELIAELQNLIDEIEEIDEDDTGVFKMVNLYDLDGSDYITASIEE